MSPAVCWTRTFPALDALSMVADMPLVNSCVALPMVEALATVTLPPSTPAPSPTPELSANRPTPPEPSVAMVLPLVVVMVTLPLPPLAA